MILTKKTDAYIGIGANLGDAQDTVKQAIAALGQLPKTRLHTQSKLFRSAPINAEGDDYINTVVQIKTHLPPQELLEALQNIEHQFGRTRPYPNAPRTLDLDILLYGQQEIASHTLTVPHPRLTERAFVLIPLLHIDPFLIIPGKGPAHLFVQKVAEQRIQPI